MKSLENWIGFTEEDLKMAELALKEGIYSQCCFHSDQYVEKVLKGFINYTGDLHPQTYKSADILAKLPLGPFDKIRDQFFTLDRFYIQTRYPDALPGSLTEGLPIETHVKEAIQIAQSILNLAQKGIQ